MSNLEAFIEVKDLGKRYEENGINVLEAVNLTIRKGEFHVLLGPSGCGKSTLLNLLAGFIQKSAGSIRINGEEVRKPGKERGVVFQNADSAIFPWLTVKDNVEYGLRMKGMKEKDRRVISDQYLQLVGMGEHAKKYPRELSGGMKQRVQMARSLANDSEILIMDEPFGALDAHTRRIMQIELVKIWQKTGKTILFVTHDIQEAILLGQRISIMSTYPDATIYKIYDNNLPYHRDITSAGFGDLYTQVQSHFDFGAGI